MKLILILFTCLISNSFLAQKNEQDSISLIKIESYLKKADNFYKSNLDSALFYLEKAKPKVFKLKDENFIAKFRLYESKFLLYKENYKDIFQVLKPNIENKKRIDSILLGRSYKDIGHAYKQMWIPDSALVNYINALKIFQKIDDRREISLTYLALGLVYSKLENESLKEEFYNKSIAYSTNSEIIEKHGEYLKDNTKLSVDEKSIGLLLDIEKIARTQNNDRLLAVTYFDLKKDYFRIKQYNKALVYAEKELELRKNVKFNSTIANTQNFIASIYTIQKNNKLAESYYKEALKTANDSLKLSIYKNLKQLYVYQKDWENAFKIQDKYALLKDSVYHRNTETSIAEITEKYQSELKEEKIKSLGIANELQENKIVKQRGWIIGGLLSFLLVLIVVYFGYKTYKSKQESQYSRLNFRLLQTQLNPHFMFNALNSIGLQLKDKESSNYLASYGMLMRHILNGSRSDFVLLKEEVSLIEKYLQIQQLVHNNKFNFKVEVDEELDLNYVSIPPMITQPFVENAVIHGVEGLENGKIHVNYFLEEDKIIVSIVDNGKGLKDIDNSGSQNLHESLGAEIIEERIKNYQKLHEFLIEVKIESKPNKGLSVFIKFPLRLKNV